KMQPRPLCQLGQRRLRLRFSLPSVNIGFDREFSGDSSSSSSGSHEKTVGGNNFGRRAGSELHAILEKLRQCKPSVRDPHRNLSVTAPLVAELMSSLERAPASPRDCTQVLG
ncbi:unnamed protein product, partial [Polarella glacialis]